MKKSFFETRPKLFMEKSFGQIDKEEIERYFLIFIFSIYLIQFFYFDYSFIKPLTEGFIFYLIAVPFYFAILKKPETLQKLVLEENSISIIAEKIENKDNTEKSLEKKEIISIEEIEYLQIVKDGIFSWQGVVFARKSKSNQKTNVTPFYLDTNELTNLEYFIQSGSGKNYKKILKKKDYYSFWDIFNSIKKIKDK